MKLPHRNSVPLPPLHIRARPVRIQNVRPPQNLVRPARILMVVGPHLGDSVPDMQVNIGHVGKDINVVVFVDIYIFTM